MIILDDRLLAAACEYPRNALLECLLERCEGAARRGCRVHIDHRHEARRQVPPEGRHRPRVDGEEDLRVLIAAAKQEPPGEWQDISLALARQIGDDRSAADAALKTVIDKHAGVDAFQIAEVYALRNDANATFEWLDRAWSNRDTGIEFLLYDPFILRYKDDPRFAAFCRKVGLPVPGERRT